MGADDDEVHGAGLDALQDRGPRLAEGHGRLGGWIARAGPRERVLERLSGGASDIIGAPVDPPTCVPYAVYAAGGSQLEWKSVSFAPNVAAIWIARSSARSAGALKSVGTRMCLHASMRCSSALRDARSAPPRTLSSRHASVSPWFHFLDHQAVKPPST